MFLPSRGIRFKFTVLSAAALVLMSAAGCDRSGGSGKVSVPPAADVTAVRAAGQFSAPAEVTGSVTAHTRIDLSTRIPAYIRELIVREGDPVQTGDVIARLDPTDIEAAVDRARAQVQVAQSARDNAKLDADKYGALRKEGLISDKDWRLISLKLTKAQTDLTQAQAALRQAEGQREYITITSPVTGHVVRRLREAGDMAVPGFPVVTVESSGETEFRIDVPEDMLAFLTPGTKAEVSVDGHSKPLPATVARVVPSADRVTRTFRVDLTFDSQDEKLYPGLFGRVRFERPALDIPAVPLTALTERGGLPGVFVVRDGKAHFCWLRLGRTGATHREVLAGVTAGELLVDRPGAALTDGTPVRVTEAAR